MTKFMTADEAVGLIRDGDMVALCGSGGGVMEPYATLEALERRFLTTGHPRDLGLMHCSGIGNHKEAGISRFAHKGMIRRVVGGHWGWSPQMQKMANDGEIEAYNFSQGVISQLYREIAAHRPGLITSVGKYTFVDPRNDGGKLNDRTKEDLVTLITIGEKDYLMYKSFPVNVAIIRGSFGDEDGNISFAQEPAKLDALQAAQAAHNSGGIVIAQVKYPAAKGTLRKNQVYIPGVYVDAVVVDPGQMQTQEGEYNPAFSGEVVLPVDAMEPMPLNQRKIVARRAFMELKEHAIINLGFGMSDGVAAIAAEENFSDKIIMTIEQGIYGGVPATGDIFGVASNAVACLDEASQFDFYSGHGLDMTFLGMAQIDPAGNVNVSRFGSTIAGSGGFIDITQSAKKIVYCGTLTAGGLKTAVEDGKLKILQEGRNKKFLKKIDHLTYSTKYADEFGQEVVYCTERCVFRYVNGKLVLTEIAPGIDLERDILSQMEFMPEIAPDLKTMDERIFRTEKMNCK